MAATPTTPTIPTRFLGRSGLRISEFALGPYSSTIVDPAGKETFFAVLDTYVQAGGNHIDLSNAYRGAEKLVGEWLKARAGTVKREDIYIASKVGLPIGMGPNQRGHSRTLMYNAIKQTLEDLGTDYVDLYYLHIWDYGTPIEESLRTLNDFVRSGKVRYIGASNFCGWQLQKAMDVARAHNLEGFVAVQNQYNCLDRFVEYEVAEVARQEGIAIIPWGTTAAGFLTGRFTRTSGDTYQDGSRAKLEAKMGQNRNSYETRNEERTWRTLDALQEVATARGKTVAQVALNWLRDAPYVVAPILGPRNVEQLKDSLGAIGWALTAEERARINEASKMPTLQPQGFVDMFNGTDRKHTQ